jgi:hypothetical protein
MAIVDVVQNKGFDLALMVVVPVVTLSTAPLPFLHDQLVKIRVMWCAPLPILIWGIGS